MQYIELPDWARSAKNRAIPLYKSSPNVTKPILLIGGVHGDEPEGVWLADSTLEWLKSDTASEGKTRVPWVLIPCLNPDGFTAKTRVNGNNVDLNRNYPSHDWSAKFSKDRYYPGPHAASEPEIQSLVRLIEEVRPRLIIHCHSWHPCIVCTGEPGMVAARALAESSGYEVKSEIGYPTPGSLSCYGWHDKQIPVICIEEVEGCAREDVWPHFAAGMKKIFLAPTEPIA